MFPHHPPHPPPNYCCQVALLSPNDCLDGEIAAVQPLLTASRGFWDPVRLDAALHPPVTSNISCKGTSFTFMPVETVGRQARFKWHGT